MKFYPVYQDEYVKKSRGNEMATPARAAGMSGVTVEEEQLMRGEPSAQRSGLNSLPAQLQSDHLIQRIIFSIQNHYMFPGTFLTCCFLSGAVLCQTRSWNAGSSVPKSIKASELKCVFC